jgi:hypothetical protein
MIRKQN